MLTADALDLVAAKFRILNARQRACGLPPLHEADLTWEHRAAELQARVNLLAADGPSMDLLAAVGAHTVAAMLALDEAEMVNVASGEETP